MRTRLLLLPCLALSLFPWQSGLAAEVPPWPVFSPASASLPMGPNLLANPGFEAGPPEAADGWRPLRSGYAVDPRGGRGGGRALRLVNDPAEDYHGALQVITLAQTEPRPVYLAGWSRAEGVTGAVDGDYSVYLDLHYADGTPLYGQRLDFEVGSHGWQRLERFILPAKPIQTIHVYCLLRFGHRGSAWFDDLAVREVEARILSFDGSAVALAERPAGLEGGEAVVLETGAAPARLALRLAAAGGAVAGIRLHGDSEVGDARRDYLGGFIVRDVAAGGAFLHVGGRVEAAGPGLARHQATLPEQGLRFAASYRALPDRIAVRAAITDVTGADRAISLYFALPLSLGGFPRRWHDDIRSSRVVSGTEELSNPSTWWRGLGANGRLSRYPFAALSTPAGGLALAVPPERPRVLRFAQSPTTGQYYLALDLGLSPAASKQPGAAVVDFLIYPLWAEAAWGFRDAAQGYFDRFPEAFRRRIPPEREGLWVAFSDLAPIPDLADFGIAVHELGDLRQSAFDETAGILSFRYLSEPWSHWLPIDDPAVDPGNYDQVLRYLTELEWGGDRRARATLASAFHDADGRLRYRSTVAPWCRGQAGCAVFTVNPDPDIADPRYKLNKAGLEWSSGAQAAYDSLPLDGEYVDSYLAEATTLDYRREHAAASDLPLAFATGSWRLGVPEGFATTEFAQWLSDDVHERLGKLTMANGLLLDLWWGLDRFDYLGRETDWIRDGQWRPDPDGLLAYNRTLSYQRPYGLLMNTDFAQMGPERVERYFQTALFYGLYPSFFSHNAAEDRYWDEPALYERDRPLFRRYLPLIRRLNQAGWRPIPFAESPLASVDLERFGAWPALYFTVRNRSLDRPAELDLSLHARELGLPPAPLAARALLSGADLVLAPDPPARARLRLRLPPDSVEILQLSGTRLLLPAVVQGAYP